MSLKVGENENVVKVWLN